MTKVKLNSSLILLLFLMATGCSSSEGSKIESGVEADEKVQEVELNEIVKSATADPVKSESKEDTESKKSEAKQPNDMPFPRLEIDLPELPIDKKLLPQVMALDQMLIDDSELEAVHKTIYEELQKLEEKSETSMSGTFEDIIKAVLDMVNGMKDFEQFVQPMAISATEKFKAKYQDDADFVERYRTTYYAAEEEINGPTVVNSEDDYIIKDRVKRSEVSTHFRNGYRTSRSSELSAVEDLMEKSEVIRQHIIDRVLSSANTDLMVADYKKGKDLVDMLNSTKNKLNLVRTLDMYNKKIVESLVTVDEKKKSRIEEVKKALETYHFPKAYDAADGPDNPLDLEKRMKVYLEKNEYDVREIVLASRWIPVRNIYDVLIYYQIDFYVAAKYSDSESGVLDVLYVTGKTGGADQSSFATYSVGGIGQMLEKNL